MVIKVWGITEGPISVDDMPDDEDFPKGAEFFIVCKVEIDGEIDHFNFWFEDLDDICVWQKYFSKNIEPLEINEDYKERIL